MQQFKRYLQSINEWIGRGIAWLTLLMVLVTFLIVLLRYVFNTGWIAMQESVTYMHAMVFMLGTAYTLRQDGHVRVDIFYQNMSPRNKAVINMLGTLLLLFPVCIFIFYSSWNYVTDAWALRESSGEAGGLPWVYLLKTTLLLMPLLLMLQGLAQFISSLQIILEAAASASSTQDEV